MAAGTTKTSRRSTKRSTKRSPRKPAPIEAGESKSPGLWSRFQAAMALALAWILGHVRISAFRVIAALVIFVAGGVIGFILHENSTAPAPTLAAECCDLACGVESRSLASDAAQISAALSGVAGRDHDDLIGQFSDARAAIETALDDDRRLPWAPWSEAINLLLTAANNEGRLETPRDGDHYLNAIASGLRLAAEKD